MSDTYDDALEMAQIEFIETYENGGNITLEYWARKYPQYIPEMVDFILDYVMLENRLKRNPPPDGPAPQWAVDVMNRTLLSLGITPVGYSPTNELIALPSSPTHTN